MKPERLAVHLCALVLLAAACGSTDSLPRFPGLVATWSVNADRTEATCWERGTFFTDPAGWEVYSGACGTTVSCEACP